MVTRHLRERVLCSLSRRKIPKTKAPFEHLEEIAIHSFYARTVVLFHAHVEEILPTWSGFGRKPNTSSTASLIQSSWPSLTVVLANLCCIFVNVDPSSGLIARLCCSRSSLNSGLWHGFQPPRRDPAPLPRFSFFWKPISARSRQYSLFIRAV
jgi:hypothetical protein